MQARIQKDHPFKRFLAWISPALATSPASWRGFFGPLARNRENFQNIGFGLPQSVHLFAFFLLSSGGDRKLCFFSVSDVRISSRLTGLHSYPLEAISAPVAAQCVELSCDHPYASLHFLLLFLLALQTFTMPAGSQLAGLYHDDVESLMEAFCVPP